MKRLAWLLTLPLAVVIVVFAVNNRTPVPMDPWPLDQPFAVPLYIIVLGALLLGFIAGALVQWAAAGKRRSQARRNLRRLNELERAGAAAKTAGANSNSPSGDPGQTNTRLLTAAES